MGKAINEELGTVLVKEKQGKQLESRLVAWKKWQGVQRFEPLRFNFWKEFLLHKAEFRLSLLNLHRLYPHRLE